jgi:hypothetical protein
VAHPSQMRQIQIMIPRLILVGASLLIVTACSSTPNGIRVTKDGTSATSSKEGAQIRNFTAAEIGPTVVGKTFQYTRKDGTGFVVFNADGSLSITDDQKGASKGTWSANGAEYCESYGANPKECGVFKYTGDAYFAANSRLVEMKI